MSCDRFRRSVSHCEGDTHELTAWQRVYLATHIWHRLAGAQVVDLHIVNFVYEHLEGRFLLKIKT